MLLRRLSALLATVLVASGPMISLAATPAAATNCSYSSRLGTEPVYTPTGVYVGYVELLYASSCRSNLAHFHIDSAYRANHSGWNVDLGLWNHKGQPVELQRTSVLNSSSTDFTTPPSSIDNHADYTFMAFVSWRYNGCLTETGSDWWNYANGTPSTNTWGDSSGTC